jgi:TrmH family RNA methyltransferase
MPSRRITSLANPKIKKVVRLRALKERRAEGVTIVEGYKEISRALEGRVFFKEVYVCPELFPGAGEAASCRLLFDRLAASQICLYETTKAVFSKIAYGDRQEGILAVCQTPQRSLADMRLKESPLLVVVESVEKPGNLGAILRICDGAGVDGMIVCDPKTDLYNPNVVRASLGTIFSVPTVVSSSAEAFDFFKSKGITVCAASPQAKDIYTRVNLQWPLAVVVGSEDEGLSDFWMQKSGLLVKIPMHGVADSLNVSASTAILVYEALRQRTL